MTGTRQLKLPVPVHIVTGGLGAGKTTILQEILQQKPTTQIWAVIVNEFGAIGIDQAVLQAAAQDRSEVHVQQLAGGCMCCALSGVTSIAIAQIIRRVKPDRLWIEPSGLGEPATLVDILQGQHLSSALCLQPIICVIDTSQFLEKEAAFLKNQVYNDQVSMADILVGSKADAASPAALLRFMSWTKHFYPPKLKILLAEKGVLRLETELESSEIEGALDALSISHDTLPSQPGGSRSSSSSDEVIGNAATLPLELGRVRRSHLPSDLTWFSNARLEQPLKGSPHRKQARDARLGMAACGWVFHPGDVFRQARVRQFLQLAQQHVQRAKGVLRVSSKTWVSVAAGTGAQGAGSPDTCERMGAARSITSVTGATEADTHFQEVAYRRDSRLELIVRLPAECQGQADVGAEDSCEQAGGVAAAVLNDEGKGSSTSLSTEVSESLDADIVAAAFAAGQQGEWEPLHAIVLSLLQE